MYKQGWIYEIQEYIGFDLVNILVRFALHRICRGQWQLRVL